MRIQEGSAGSACRKSGLLFAALAAAAAGFNGPVMAGSFDLWGANVDYQLQGAYALGVRIEKPDDGIINSKPASSIPLPDYLKLPESINYDDGDRNFKQGSLVNNRLSVLSEVLITNDDYGILLRGDAFYDDSYRHTNDNDSPETVNKTGPHNEFTDYARSLSGLRGRLLEAYAFGTWDVTDEMILNLRVGRQVAAWGESLFFSGVALAQGPADATKATVPGADVKSILLPVNQVSASFTLTDKITLLGQYKLAFKEIEINPVGEFFSPTDVVGPGAEFIYGIDNPFFLSNLTDVNLASDDAVEAVDVIRRLVAPSAPVGPFTDALAAILANLDPTLPDVPLPDLGAATPAGTPKYINVQRGPDILPSPYGQWGLGAKYQLASNTNVGIYRLRYHSNIGLPVQNYGDAVLIPSDGVRPDVTTQQLGLTGGVPVTYNIKYFDGVDLSSLSFSTVLFGANVGGELNFREGIPVLVDVDGGLLGPIPSPTRADVSQVLISGLYLWGPGPFWDSIVLVGETGYIHVNNVEENCSPYSCSKKLTFDRDAWAWSFLSYVESKNVFDGWDLQVPITLAGTGKGHTSLPGGLGSQMGRDDYRAGIGINMTRLQQLTVGLSYSGFIGTPNFKDRPYQDRDFAAFTVKYNF